MLGKLKKNHVISCELQLDLISRDFFEYSQHCVSNEEI